MFQLRRFELKLHFLEALTLDGKDIGFFEEQIGPFLLTLMPSVVSGERLDVFLPLLRNFIRYNSSYLDEDVVPGLIKQTCQICTTTEKETEMELSLSVLDAVIRYSSLPSNALYSFLVAVCHTVNVKQFCEPSWRLMRHLLGTHLGHNGVLTMCCILEDSKNWTNVLLLRGAVFFVGMCLWGSKRVTSLLHKPVTVLPSFYKVLSCDIEQVISEVTLSMQRLVKKYGMKQHDAAWESILDIASAVQEYVERDPSCTVLDDFHVLLSHIEELCEKHEFHGSADKLFAIVEKCTLKRPESSVILLVSHRAQSLHPYCTNWFENIHDLVHKYFKCEERTAIRIKVLDVLCNILGTFSPLYEEEILENSVLPYLEDIAKDQDIAVRIRAVQLLVDVIEGSDSQKVCDVLNIIEKIAHCPVDPLKRYVRPSQHGPNTEQPQDEKVLEDIKEAVLGLVRLFEVKLFRKPREHAERIFNILVFHIKAHYDNGYKTVIASQIRLAILKCFLSLRADSCQRLGIVQDNSEVKFSSYFACTERTSSSEEKTSGLVSLPYSEAMNIILICLQQEWEWEVLDVVLRIIPETLQDKNLILSGKQYLNSLCIVLSKMVSNEDFLPGLFRVPHDMGRPKLYARIFPVLTELCTYHPYIGQDEQLCLICTMEIGLVGHSADAALCISCLTICMLEIRSVMARLLPTYLEKFAKLSPTPQVAIPILEFLSALSHLRDLYTNFTAVQYEQVFDICLPYTESSRYTQYTVTLAHNVICSWYVNCPLLLRKQFVSLITKGLKHTEISPNISPSYPNVPTSPTKLQPTPVHPEKTNEDSSNSLSSEMIEIAIDMMVKYAFSPSLTQPKRTAVVEQLLANGTSRSWLLGNILVTVTVSKRTPSNMPCAYCSAGKIAINENVSTPLAGTETKSATVDQRAVGSKIPSDIKNHAEETATRQNTSVGLSSDKASHKISSLKANTNTAGPLTVEPPATSTEGSREQSRDSASECSCVCQGWAEFLVRRPTGNTSWILRLQNRPKLTGDFAQSRRTLAAQTAPQIYESLIPKQFFDDLSAELIQERARQHLASTTGLLSKSADSDTLIVDLIKDRLLIVKEDNGWTPPREGEEGTTSRSKQADEMDEGSTEVNTSVGVADAQSGECDTGDKSGKEDIVSSHDSGTKSNLVASFVERTRYLSSSPMEGPSAFMLLDVVPDAKNDVLLENDSQGSDHDSSRQDEFQKPVVGKSPLDASPLKNFLTRDGTGLGESEDDSAENSENEGISPSFENDDLNQTPALIPINISNIQDTIDVTSAKATTSLPGSRAQSPLGAVGRCHRMSDTSSGSVSLPSTPLLSRTKSPEFFSAKTSGKTSRNGRRTVSPVADVAGRKTPTKKVTLKQNKSATVDLGMLRRTSSSPEITEPVKEKRGLLKFFDNVSEKENKEKKESVILRRQTMSGSQLPNKNANRAKRRSYNGPFSDSVTEGCEENAEDVSSAYGALSPNFIFLQFFHSSWFSEDEIPLALPEQEFYHRAVKNLDRIPPYDTHKIGVIYVGADQGNDEVSILRNQYGSSRYMEFLSGLGELVRLRDCLLCEVYTGGLEKNGADGEYAYSWRSDIAQVMFHIATLMPNKENDPNCHSKKLHIGNDFVTIVYNESKSTYKMGTIKGQFNFVEIAIEPLDNECNVIRLNVKDELKDIFINTNYGPRVISDGNLPILVRHMALHVNMASVIHKSQKTPTDAYGCNWLQRLRQIKRIQSRIPSAGTKTESLVPRKDLHNVVDFTKYILQ